MNHATWTRSLLAISLALNLGVVAALVLRQPPPADPPATAHEAPVNLQDYLELTGEQRQHWQQLEPGFLTEVSANWNAIRKHREALVRHIFAAAPDRQAIDAEQAAIARLQAERGAALAGGELGQAKAFSGLLNLPAQVLGAQYGAGGKLGLGFGSLF